jgi:hypothetical protein
MITYQLYQLIIINSHEYNQLIINYFDNHIKYIVQISIIILMKYQIYCRNINYIAEISITVFKYQLYSCTAVLWYIYEYNQLKIKYVNKNIIYNTNDQKLSIISINYDKFTNQVNL